MIAFKLFWFDLAQSDFEARFENFQRPKSERLAFPLMYTGSPPDVNCPRINDSKYGS
jgi:hypothetical protein